MRQAIKKGAVRQSGWRRTSVLFFLLVGRSLFLKNYIKPVIGVHYDVVGTGSGGGRKELGGT